MSLDQQPSLPRLSGEIFESLPESIRSYIRFLEETIMQQQERIQQQQECIQQQQERIQQLEIRVHELENQLSKDSSNSSKPPGNDGFKKKTKSLRTKSGKKPGGQYGRVGKGLTQIDNPDCIIPHVPIRCHGCGSSLDHVDGDCAEKRQVFDIPKPRVEVTEHRTVEKQCPSCGEICRGKFPENIRGPVQYGERVQALTAYFAHQHFVPVDRMCQMFEDIFGIAISPGTCANVDKRLYCQLEPFASSLKTALLGSEVLHFDETGMRSEKKLRWVHVASSQMATMYTMHVKRGQEAMEEAGILPQFKGVGVHDHWIPYFMYKKMEHALCNAHHLRELTFVQEQEKEKWAEQMKSLLIFAKKEVEENVEEGYLTKETVEEIEEKYTRIINEGLEYHEKLEPLPKGKRGKQKQRAGKNLLDRLNKKRSCVLMFMYDFRVPFTNNRGEQDIRMVKLKQKISGCFRTYIGGQVFCRIRSYISTARKQGWNVWDTLADAIRGSPRLLEIELAS